MSQICLAATRSLQSTEKELLMVREPATRLMELSRSVLAQQATPEEILELQRLLEPPGAPR
jgi:hypothetical protein